VPFLLLLLLVFGGAVSAGAAAPERQPAAKPGDKPAEKPAEKPADKPAAEVVEKEPPDAASFEAVAGTARRTNDVATLLAPFVDRCDGEKREIDKLRCRATQSYLRKTLPSRAFIVAAEDPAAIWISDYDAGVRGYRVGLSGCLACSKPVKIGRSGERRFVTMKVPQKEAESLPAAVELSRGTVGFENLAEARRWMEAVRPHLRAEFVFAPTENEWSFGPSRGYALKFLAARIYNRCTGEVLVSRPPSTAQAERPPGYNEGCPRTGEDASPGPHRARQASDEEIPEQLSKAAIAESMGQVRAQVFDCYRKYQVPGNAQVTYMVAGNGMVQSIRLGGAFDGTPTGECIMAAAKNARFPRFRAERQTFTYPFFLRR
jgi:hypothetical protein